MLTKDERDAVAACEKQRCTDEWCDGLCEVCGGGYVLLGDALRAIDDVRAKRRNDRDARLQALLED